MPVVRSNPSDLSETARKVFELENQEIYHLSTEAESNKFNDDYLAANKADLAKRVAGMFKSIRHFSPLIRSEYTNAVLYSSC